MSQRHFVTLRDIAHARAGDKGDISSISLWVFDPAHFPAIVDQVTGLRVKAAFPRLIRGPVDRHVLTELCGLNFVLRGALEGGVNGSLNLDGHGKSWSFLLLGLTVELDARHAG
jgi:hypothetical protein